MTDLDLKIAELKGWRPEKPFDQIRELDEVYWLDQNGKRTEFAVVGFYHCDGAEGWDHGYHVPEFSPSCNIAQAFELVDEVLAMGPGWSFHLDSSQLDRVHLAETNFKEAVRKDEWSGVFMHGLAQFCGKETTRSEAICRAYIALKEWEGKK